MQAAGQKPSEMSLQGRGLDTHAKVQKVVSPVRVLRLFASVVQLSYRL
jgi:hypothetical protein